MATPAPATQWNTELLQRLFARGLGELLILHGRGTEVMLGQVGLKKNRLLLSDTRFLTGVRASDVSPCWESGLLGMISASDGYEWSSLTFHGLNQCRGKVDLSRTRGSRLSAAHDADGEGLMDFVGSVYRGFRLLLNHHFLPVVMLQKVQARNDERGFAVVDLRMGAIDLAAIRIINDAVRRSTERHVEVDIVEEDVQDEKFEELFGDFLARPLPQEKKSFQKGAPGPQSAATLTSVIVSVLPPLPDTAHYLAPTDVARQVLDMLREVVEEIGAARAFALFERWVTRIAVARTEYLRQTQNIQCHSVHDYFEIIAAQMRLAGETHVIVQENGGAILHEIRDCIYREACRGSGVDAEGRWSTCAQAIPGVRSKVAAALDPRLTWTWTSCDRRAGHACVFEMSLKDKT